MFGKNVISCCKVELDSEKMKDKKDLISNFERTYVLEKKDGEKNLIGLAFEQPLPKDFSGLKDEWTFFLLHFVGNACTEDEYIVSEYKEWDTGFQLKAVEATSYLDKKYIEINVRVDFEKGEAESFFTPIDGVSPGPDDIFVPRF